MNYSWQKSHLSLFSLYMMEGFCQLEMQNSKMMDFLNVTTEIKNYLLLFMFSLIGFGNPNLFGLDFSNQA